jgi:hypothetical protein
MPASHPSLKNNIRLAKVENDLLPFCDLHPVKLGERLRSVCLSVMAPGVFLGANIANHCRDSNPCRPDSETVGTSGNTPVRLVLRCQEP